jgi:hypothetical protein
VMSTVHQHVHRSNEHARRLEDRHREREERSPASPRPPAKSPDSNETTPIDGARGRGSTNPHVAGAGQSASAATTA